MAITPDIWGPHGWKFMHYVALAYPVKPTADQKIQYKTFFESIQNILPCGLCSHNYKKHLKELPIDDSVLESNITLLKWTIDMHNKVNVENGKREYTSEEVVNLLINNFGATNFGDKKGEETKEKFEDTDKPKEKNNSNFFNFSFCIFIFVFLVTISIIYKKTPI
jgi:hypothetical protein